MAADRHWAHITSGASFEALATTLVFFEDANAALFGRRGKDGGQDARSGDGSRVFQAKHHADESASTAIADARKEAQKIRAYRAGGHPREPQWRGVTHWRLVTNATFNPTDRQKWDTTVVPLFTNQGLAVDYWERANLEALLARHPEVDRAFFQNETRVFLSLPEAREKVQAEEPFLRRPYGTFVGRAVERQQLEDFLSSDALFLIVHGAGGIGKTRFVIEAGEDVAAAGNWQVLWANVASMIASSAWFEAIVPERPTLLLVDEPDDDQLLKVLAEQLGSHTSRTKLWKVVVAARSPKDPVLRFLRGPRMVHSVREVVLNPLAPDESKAMCLDLISSSSILVALPVDAREAAATHLAKSFSHHPVWLTLAVHVLEAEGDLAKVPRTAEGLADKYFEEITTPQKDASAKQVRELLQWVALIGTVNRNDATAVRLIAQGSGVGTETTARTIMARLIERRALFQRGAGSRLVEIKPDVLRDHLLHQWLVADTGGTPTQYIPSDDAKRLVESVCADVLAANANPLVRGILASLGRTELLLELAGQRVGLLDSLFSRLHPALPTLPALSRIAVAEVLVDVAFFRPEDTVGLSRALRASPAQAQTVDEIFGTRNLGQDDIILVLGWLLFHAAMGARTPAEEEDVLEELCALTAAEAEFEQRHRLPNDGKRARDLVRRAIEGGPQFLGEFDDASAKVAGRLLSQLDRAEPTKGTAAALNALLKAALSAERQQTWTEQYTFKMQTYVIGPDHPAWTARESILKRLKGLLADADVPRPTKTLLWGLMAEGHRTVNRCRGQGSSEFQKTLRQQLLDDLQWARSALARTDPSLSELSAARELWDWHRDFESDAELKEAAAQLESLYRADELAREFEPLLQHRDWGAREKNASDKASELAKGATSEPISAFFDRAARFFGNEHEIYRLKPIAFDVGAQGPRSEAARAFVRETLGGVFSPSRTYLAAVMAQQWVASVRATGAHEDSYHLVVELLAKCGSDEKRVTLLENLYAQPVRPPADRVGPDEHSHLRSLAQLFASTGSSVTFLAAIGWTVGHDWPGLKSVIERVLDQTQPAQLVPSMGVLIEALYSGINEKSVAASPDDLGEWLLNQLLRLPDVQAIGGNVEWYLEEVLKKTRRPSVAWLPEALRKRSEMETHAGYANVHAVSYHERLSRYIKPLSAADAGDSAVEALVAELVGLAANSGTVGFYLPAMLRDVDPEGVFAPAAVAGLVGAASTIEQIRRLSRIAGGYALGSPAWRAIAKPSLARAAATGTTEEQRSILSTLTPDGIRSWSGTPGVVPSIFVSAVQFAKEMLIAELDEDVRRFWQWHLAAAEAELREQEELAKEERGE